MRSALGLGTPEHRSPIRCYPRVCERTAHSVRSRIERIKALFLNYITMKSPEGGWIKREQPGSRELSLLVWRMLIVITSTRKSFCRSA